MIELCKGDFLFKYSIIIPVYNAQAYIERSVNSIISQTYQDFEIILVNDGSTDNSSEICHALKDNFPDRIVVIDSENSGTSDARNKGLSVATGDYIGFLDNDDFWTKNDLLENLDLRLSKSNADTIIFLCQIYDDETGKVVPKKIPLKSEELDGKPFFKRAELLLEKSVIESAVWVRFTKREIVFGEPALLFPSKMRNEDTDWTANLLLKISSVDYYDCIAYAYRKGTSYSQTSRGIKRSHLLDLMKIIRLDADKAKNAGKQNQRIVNKFLSYPFLVLLGQLSVFAEIDEFKDFLKEYSYLLRDPKFFYMKPLYFIIRVFGVSAAVKIAGIPYKRRYPGIKHD